MRLWKVLVQISKMRTMRFLVLKIEINADSYILYYCIILKSGVGRNVLDDCQFIITPDMGESSLCTLLNWRLVPSLASKDI